MSVQFKCYVTVKQSFVRASSPRTPCSEISQKPRKGKASKRMGELWDRTDWVM